MIEKNFISKKTKFRKRLELRKFSTRYIFNRSIKNVENIFKKSMCYDTNILFINNIFFVFFINYVYKQTLNNDETKIKNNDQNCEQKIAIHAKKNATRKKIT